MRRPRSRPRTELCFSRKVTSSLPLLYYLLSLLITYFISSHLSPVKQRADPEWTKSTGQSFSETASCGEKVFKRVLQEINMLPETPELEGRQCLWRDGGPSGGQGLPPRGLAAGLLGSPVPAAGRGVTPNMRAGIDVPDAGA